MVDVATVLADLRVEGESLDTLVTALPEVRWRDRTPAPGWTVAHQIAHLAWTDDVALASATDPEGFARLVEQATRDPHSAVDGAAEQGAAAAPAELLDRWRRGRAALLVALRDVPEGRKLDWFGPPMSVASMATGRIMETWAHGQDIADALGVTREPTRRLRHVAHIGVRARDFSYTVHGQSPPTEPFRVILTGPSGEHWAWGPDEATQRVTGPALDFCLLVTQRRHRDDLAVAAQGEDARHWLTIAQAFAGPPGGGRKQGQFS